MCVLGKEMYSLERNAHDLNASLGARFSSNCLTTARLDCTRRASSLFAIQTYTRCTTVGNVTVMSQLMQDILFSKRNSWLCIEVDKGTHEPVICGCSRQKFFQSECVEKRLPWSQKLLAAAATVKGLFACYIYQHEQMSKIAQQSCLSVEQHVLCKATLCNVAIYFRFVIKEEAK